MNELEEINRKIKLLEQAQYQRAWRKKNAKKRKEHQKAWNAKNRKEYQRAYRAKNKK